MDSLISEINKTNSNNTQNILITNKDNFQFTYDYIFNRVKYNTTNIPTFIQDKNQIDKKYAPLQDVQQAIYLARKNAKKWKTSLFYKGWAS